MFFRYPNKNLKYFQKLFNLIKSSERLVPFDSANLRQKECSILIKFEKKRLKANKSDELHWTTVKFLQTPTNWRVFEGKCKE